jgi:hypothetical protein
LIGGGYYVSKCGFAVALHLRFSCIFAPWLHCLCHDMHRSWQLSDTKHILFQCWCLLSDAKHILLLWMVFCSCLKCNLSHCETGSYLLALADCPVLCSNKACYVEVSALFQQLIMLYFSPCKCFYACFFDHFLKICCSFFQVLEVLDQEVPEEAQCT